MKRTRKKTPKHQDLRLRDEYRELNYYDEWSVWLDFEVDQIESIASDDMRRDMDLECNHIFSNPRRDRVPVLIMLSKLSHDFFHAHLQEGRVLCLLAKFYKGEADLDLWDRAFGKSVAGWAENLTYSPDHWCYVYWRALLVMFQEYERFGWRGAA